jgi:hypothetical protein
VIVVKLAVDWFGPERQPVRHRSLQGHAGSLLLAWTQLKFIRATSEIPATGSSLLRPNSPSVAVVKDSLECGRSLLCPSSVRNVRALDPINATASHPSCNRLATGVKHSLLLIISARVRSPAQRAAALRLKLSQLLVLRSLKILGRRAHSCQSKPGPLCSRLARCSVGPRHCCVVHDASVRMCQPSN